MLKAKMAALAVSVLAAGGLALAAAPAHASTTWTATTSVTADPDSGGNGIWAEDYFSRTLTISADTDSADCNFSGYTSADDCYMATIADSGYAQTTPGAYQPNQGSTTTADQTGDKVNSPTEQVPFSGSAQYFFWVNTSITTVLPNSADVPSSLNDGNSVPSGANSTDEWFLQAFPVSVQSAVHGEIQSTWSWTYTDGCSTGPWVDSFADNSGQSSPLSVDGNIVGGGLCTPVTSPVGGTLSDYGNEVNPSGNGFDVFRQHFAVNGEIAGWAATQGDVATHFLRIAEGSNWSFEAAPNGSGDGLCVSNPEGGYAGDPGGPTGLVLRDCNGSIFQQFYASSGYLHSAADGQYVNPDGSGAALRTASSPVSWGGSKWTWTPYASLP
jgi:hypothetical protein